jgi:hypothetical protein
MVPLNYRFGPLERRGLLLGLGGGQLAVLGMGGLGAVVALRVARGPLAPELAGGLAVAALAVALWPIGGRPLEAWVPLLGAFAWRRLRGRHRFHPRPHLEGHRLVVTRRGKLLEAVPPGPRPESVRDLQLLEARPGTDAAWALGVVRDGRERTYTGVLRVRGHAFNLLDSAERARLIEAWAAILASYGVEGSPVSRLQWLERTLPDDGQGIVRHFRERVRSEAPARALEAYREALAGAAPATQLHECLVALQVDARRAWRQVRQAGRGDPDRGACALVSRELVALGEALEGAGVMCEGILSARGLSKVVRAAYEPEAWQERSLIETEGGPEGPHPDDAWPRQTFEGLSHYRTGPRAFHATYHVREWPRVEVGPGFLAPVLLRTRCTRTISMTLQPIPPSRAERELRRARVSDLSDEELRRRGGWLPSVRRTHEQENVLRAEEELAQGHVSYRFSGYVTVTAASLEELAEASAEVEQLARRSHLELERLIGQQEVAFTYTLPLCRGLA